MKSIFLNQIAKIICVSLLCISCHAQNVYEEDSVATQVEQKLQSHISKMIRCHVNLHLDEQSPKFYTRNPYVRQCKIFRNEERFEAIMISGKDKMHVSGKFKCYIPVLHKSKNANEIINENDLELLEIKCNFAKQGIVSERKQMIGMCACGNIEEKAPVMRNNVRMLVKKGESTRVFVNNGGLCIESSGSALSSGNLGDDVKAKCQHGVISGKVSGLKTINVS